MVVSVITRGRLSEVLHNAMLPHEWYCLVCAADLENNDCCTLTLLSFAMLEHGTSRPIGCASSTGAFGSLASSYWFTL